MFGSFVTHIITASEGSSSCLDCPIGSLCPYPAMTYHQPCPPGQVCSSKGLISTDVLCPAGSFCAGGVMTNDTNSTLPVKPILCPGSYYCLPGAGTACVLVVV